MTTMNDKTWDKLCDAFHSYWIENNDNGSWPKHRTTLTGSWRRLVDDDPDPSWSVKEAALRINGLRKLAAQAERYNTAQAHALGQNYLTARELRA